MQTLRPLTYLALTGLCTTLCFADLPDANTVLKTLNKADTPATTNRNYVANYHKKLERASDAEDRVRAWLTTYRLWAVDFSKNDDWEQQDYFEKQLGLLGRYFPNKANWTELRSQIDQTVAQTRKNNLKALSFILALLENDEAMAIQIFQSNHSATSGSGKTQGTSSGILRALTGIDSYDSYDSFDNDGLVNLAIEQSSMTKLQRIAYETMITNSKRSDYYTYYGNIPDLTKLYTSDQLPEKLNELVFVQKEYLSAYNLPQKMIPLVYAALRANNLTPDDSFHDFLDPKSPTYTEDIAYYVSKHSGTKMGDQAYLKQIVSKLKSNDAEGAWEAWAAYAEANSEKAASFLESLFGYQSRNYQRSTIVDFAMRLLELSDNPQLLSLLSHGLPLEGSENDPLLVKLRALKQDSASAETQLIYAFIELDRLLAVGLEAQSVEAANAVLELSEGLIDNLPEEDATERLLRYARAFKLLNNPALSDAFLELSIQSIEQQEGYQREYSCSSLAAYYVELGEFEKAFEQLFKSAQSANPAELQRGEVEIASALGGMAEIYAQAGRHQDAIALLDQAIGWGVKDLREVSFYSEFHDFKVTIANSLHHLGRSAEARDILKDHLRYENNSADAAYQALIEIDGQASAAFFKELQAEDPFQERPLIWQAVLLQKAGELEAAEEMARHAISIDPTDGEANSINRLRAYAVLGDILKARNHDEAITFERIVTAVDLSEKADEYRIAGLASHALERYQAALDLFADAYCVRFRTAVELEAAGQYALAEEHFEAAYTLMPDQFGRIESHCFGCEGAFTGERAERIAERVFTRMLEERPNQASLHYLMGYLNESRGQPEVALANFQKAVELDPLYYNAWSHIVNLAETQNEPELALHAIRQMLSVAPLRAIDQLEYMELTSLGQLWETAESILPILPERRQSLYPLKASSKIVEKSGIDHYYGDDSRDYQAPGSLLFKNYTVTSLITESIEND